MEITGKIIELGEERSGESRNGGSWRRKQYVISYKEAGSTQQRQMVFEVANDNIDRFALQLDQMVTISIDIDSRDFNGRWINTVIAWRVQTAVEEPQQ
ncbi:MAG: DUF3127 domain-containing protein [Paludibacteraceae bacterium]|nr:DUF3127 domain-containing protein [Paludibacteraceae bacterium]